MVGVDALATIYDEARQTIVAWCREAERSVAEMMGSARASREAALAEARDIVDQARRQADETRASAEQIRASAEQFADEKAAARGVAQLAAGLLPPPDQSGPGSSGPDLAESKAAANHAADLLSEAVDVHLSALEETMLAVASITSVVGEGLAESSPFDDEIDVMRGRVDVLSESVNILLDALDALKKTVAGL